MRTFTAITGIYPPESGGPSTFISDFISWLNREYSNLEVTLIAQSNSPIRPGPRLNPVLIPKGSSGLKFIRTVIAIRRHTPKDSDVLVVGCFIETFFALLGRSNRVTVKIPGDIVWERARNRKMTSLDILEFQACNLPIRYKVMRFFFSKSIFRAQVVITPSDSILSLLDGWGVKRSKILKVSNSVNTRVFTPPSSEIFRTGMITVCRLVPWKGLAELIIASAKVNYPLTIVGDGPMRRELELLKDRFAAPVQFLGNLERGSLSEQYSRHQIFVLNSSYEGLPHSLLEALSSGLTCIVRSGTGSSEVMTDGVDGYSFDTSDQEAFESFLKKICSDKSEMKRIGNNARKLACEKYADYINFPLIRNAVIRGAEEK